MDGGTDNISKPGDTISVHYKGQLPDGTVFDSSYDRKKPITFTVAKGQVIKCWDKAFSAMHVGQKSYLVCPPSVAYGSKGFGDLIKPDSPLFFTVELVEIVKRAPVAEKPKPDE